MSDQPRSTPRTDARCRSEGHAGIPATFIHSDFARELERESDAHSERIKELETWKARLSADLVAADDLWKHAKIENAKLREACNRLLQSDEVQKAWPLDGNKRAQKPRDTFSKASVTVRFRHLLAIHQALAGKEGA